MLAHTSRQSLPWLINHDSQKMNSARPAEPELLRGATLAIGRRPMILRSQTRSTGEQLDGQAANAGHSHTEKAAGQRLGFELAGAEPEPGGGDVKFVQLRTTEHT